MEAWGTTLTINEGNIDRLLRILAGVGLLGLALAGIGTPWTWIGIVPLATGAIGWCPAYSLFGMNTCAVRRG